MTHVFSHFAVVNLFNRSFQQLEKFNDGNALPSKSAFMGPTIKMLNETVLIEVSSLTLVILTL
jgi:hypothetical protein